VTSILLIAASITETFIIVCFAST